MTSEIFADFTISVKLLSTQIIPFCNQIMVNKPRLLTVFPTNSGVNILSKNFKEDK